MKKTLVTNISYFPVMFHTYVKQTYHFVAIKFVSNRTIVTELAIDIDKRAVKR